jgi:heat shock protein HslJ
MRTARTLVAIVSVLTVSLAAASPALAQSEEAGTGQGRLTEVEWKVTAVGPAPPATEQTVRFEPDGGLAISTGCATYTGTYSVDGEQLNIEPTRRDFGSIEECSFGEQGSANVFRDTLEGAESWSLDDDGQLIIDAPGGWSLALEPAAPATAGSDDPAASGDAAAVELGDVTGTWELESIDVALAGETLVPPPDAAIKLTLSADGRLDGHGGCSAYEGAYTMIGEATITLSDVTAATVDTCPSELAGLQQLYLGILPVVDSVSATDGTLVLGATMLTADLTFQRAP